MARVLKFTDGTTSVELVEPGSGNLHILEYMPSMPSYKGGGVYGGSPLARGRQLRFAQLDLIEETLRFTLKNAANQNAAIAELRTLIQLLQQAAAFWTPGVRRVDPVWVERKTDTATNTDYGLLYLGHMPNLPDPWGIEFEQIALIDIELDFTVRSWDEIQPGSAGTAVAIGNEVNFNSVDYGNVNSAGTYTPTVAVGNVFIANYNVTGNITHVFHYDSSATTYSANLIDGTLPLNLLPDPADNGDHFLIGSATTVSGFPLFTNIVCDVGTATGAATWTASWGYYNGSGWTSLSLKHIDHTADEDQYTTGEVWQNTGVNPILFELQSNWAAFTINGVNAYWVRMEVSGRSGTITVPTQQNRTLYSVGWSGVKVEADQVDGDLPALARWYFSSRGEGGATHPYGFDTMFMGLRSTGRGTGFQASINMASTNNPGTISVTAAGGASIASTKLTPAGEWLSYAPGSSNPMTERAYILLGDKKDVYHGRYRAFLRVYQTAGTAGQLKIRLSQAENTNAWSKRYTETIDTPVINEFVLMDFGEISIPVNDLASSESASTARIGIEMQATAAATIAVVDLWLLPVDEWFCEVTRVNDDSDYLSDGYYLDVDSIKDLKKHIRVNVKTDAANLIDRRWRAVAGGPAILQRGEEQILWCLMANKDSTDSYLVSSVHSMVAVQAFRNQQYMTLRGGV